WVVARGEPGSVEVTIAREWLASRTEVTAARPGAGPGGGGGWVTAPRLPSLYGRAPGAARAAARPAPLLNGRPGGATPAQAHSLRTDSRGHFSFRNVVPGDYVLTDAVAGPVTWRLSIALARGERRVLDLSPSNVAGLGSR